MHDHQGDHHHGQHPDDHDLPHDHGDFDPDDPRAWDERYRADGDDVPMWSGQPNGSLVAEVADMVPGTALDIGCGEGADAIWLAQQGWQVTAFDPSGVALGRARRAATEAAVAVTWLQAGLLDLPADLGTFDLVSAQYPAVRKDADGVTARTLVDLVAPGGTLLNVHHDLDDHDAHDDHDAEHEFDPADYVMPADVAASLGDGWTIEVDETRRRPGPLPAEARHVADVVLRARRT